jgi:hypothetical protein
MPSTRAAASKIERRIAQLSVLEIADAVSRRPGLLRATVELFARAPSRRLGSVLAQFDRAIEAHGLARAARDVLARLGAQLSVVGTLPAGPVLVVMNHPGAYDAFAAMAALGRDDLAIVASDREFLRAMPRLARHLVFVCEGLRGRARALREAIARLEKGATVLQLGAGAIEPDARFVAGGEAVLEEWTGGTGLLVRYALRANAAVVPCFVSGVHSPRAKRLFFVRWAEARGVTTIAPLVQATLPGFRDVAVTVRIGEALPRQELAAAASDEARAALTREAALRLR